MPVKSVIRGSSAPVLALKSDSRGTRNQQLCVELTRSTPLQEYAMGVTQNGTLRSRRPQLNDSISKLDEMVDGLAVAIPGAVSDSIREVLGPTLTVALTDAMKEAFKEGFKEAVVEALKELKSETPAPQPVPPPAPPAPPTPRVRPDRWAKVKAAMAELKTWATKRVAPVAARAALGWAIVRVIGVSTIHSRTAILTTALTGTLTGLAGYALGPIGAAVLLGLSASTFAATAAWAAPTISLLVAIQKD